MPSWKVLNVFLEQLCQLHLLAGLGLQFITDIPGILFVDPLLVGDALWKTCFLWFWGSSQNSFCSSLVYYFMVFHYKWDLYCATMPSQHRSSMPLVQNIFYECLLHQINSIKSSYLNLSVANTRQIFQGRLVFVLYFFLLFMGSLSVFLYLKNERLGIELCWCHRLFFLDPYIPNGSWEINQKQNPWS